MKNVVVAAALAAALTGPASAGTEVATAGEGPAVEKAEGLSEHRKTCVHYDNRARFKPRIAGREGEVEYVVILAESCSLALRLAEGETPEAVRVASRRYLDRLTELRRLIVDMNVVRAFGEQAGPKAISVAGSGAAPLQGGGYRPVTATGEYLIARSLGLQSAFRRWLDAGVGFDLAGR